MVEFKWRNLGRGLQWLASNREHWWASHGERIDNDSGGPQTENHGGGLET